MYREDLPPATLVPVSRTPEHTVDLDAVQGGRGRDADIAVPAVHAAAASGESLAFRVKLVCSDAQLLRVQALRAMAYGRHLPGQGAAFGSVDPLDRAPGTVVFYAEDKLTGMVVGSARIQSNRYRPLQIEGSIELPPAQRGRHLAEITRLCVMPGYSHQVRQALLKAIHLYCLAMQIGGLVAGSRASLLRTYLCLGFVDLYGDERQCPLRHAGGLPHRVLFRDTVAADARLRELRPQDHDFMFGAFHPDIEVFDSIAQAVSFGLNFRAAVAA